MILPAIALFFATGCGDPETFYEGSETSYATVKIALANAGAEDVTVLFTPDMEAVKFEYAIGTASDKAAFDAGTLTRTTEQGNKALQHTFSDLQANTAYLIFARAYTGEDSPAGPTTTFTVRAFSGALSVQQGFLGYESMSFIMDGVPAYTVLEYALAESDSDAVIADFEKPRPQNLSKTIIEDLYRTHTATFFDLEQETEYFFLLRGQDRFGEWSETFVCSATTGSATQMPSMKIELTMSDFWVSEIKYTPSSNTPVYAIISGQPEAYDYYLGPLVYAGSYEDFLMERYRLGIDRYTETKTEGYINAEFFLDTPYVVYALLFDADGNPSSVIRKEWATPAFDESAGLAKVGVDVTPTALGGNYTFTPNSETYAFLCETYTAELIDGNDPWDPGAKDDEWITGNLLDRAAWYSSDPSLWGKCWQYKSYPELWTLTWNDDSAGDYPAGTELIVAIIPVNKNGFYGGIGELTTARYTKL